MKSPMTQIFMITLVIVFATALTVTVTLLCISYIGRTPSDLFSTMPLNYTTDAESIPFSSHASSLPQGEPTAALTEPTSTTGSSPSNSEKENQTDPVSPNSLLSFVSNGNGSCTLVGIGECRDTCITIPTHSPSGDRVTAIAPRAFYGCTEVSAIQIPASVVSIGEGAFSDCESLAYVSVSEANPYYCDLDGVLYSADLYTLHLYPPMRAGSHAIIKKATAEIMGMAFYNCRNLTHVDYEGSAEDWEKIDIGTKNYSLTAASKSFAKKSDRRSQ